MPRNYYEQLQQIATRYIEAKEEWAAIINRLTAEFSGLFCTKDGHIDWEHLTEFVSGKEKPKEGKTIA